MKRDIHNITTLKPSSPAARNAKLSAHGPQEYDFTQTFTARSSMPHRASMSEQTPNFVLRRTVALGALGLLLAGVHHELKGGHARPTHLETVSVSVDGVTINNVNDMAKRVRNLEGKSVEGTDLRPIEDDLIRAGKEEGVLPHPEDPYMVVPGETITLQIPVPDTTTKQ